MEETPEYQIDAVVEPIEQKTILFYGKPLVAVRLPDGTPAVALQPARRTRRHPEQGLRLDGSRDQRVKGTTVRKRINVRLDNEVVTFLRTIKTDRQHTTEESGYSGFVEELVRDSEAFQRWQRSQ